nr:hypothetical protein 77 [bacterium]
MPYNPKRPPKDLVKRIKNRHPEAGAKDIRQWVYVFNGIKERGGSEAAAFSQAWGVLKDKFGPKSTKKEKEETRKDVKKWERKQKRKSKKKKSSTSYELTKLAIALKNIGIPEMPQQVMDLAEEMKEVLHTESPEGIQHAHFHVFVNDNEVGVRVNLPCELDLDKEEMEELEEEIYQALDEILSDYIDDEEKGDEEKSSKATDTFS